MSDIVCICGSTRFKAEIMEVNRLETMKGNIVLAPGVFGHSGDKITDKDKSRLDQLHLTKIDMSTMVLVVSRDGYIGEGTRREIAYASQNGITIKFRNFEVAFKEQQGKEGKLK